MRRPAEDDTTPVDDVNVQAAVGLFSDFFTTYNGNADLVYSNGPVLPHAVLHQLFDAVPEAHSYLQAIVLNLVVSARDGNSARNQRRREARIGIVNRRHNEARSESRLLRYEAAMTTPPLLIPPSIDALNEPTRPLPLAPWNERQ